LPYIIEHVVKDFYKLVCVCENGMGTIIGDLPILPWCFRCKDELKVGNARVCWSDELSVRIKDYEGRLRVKGTYVSGELRSVMFILRNIPCSVDATALFNEVVSIVNKLCREGKVST